MTHYQIPGSSSFARTNRQTIAQRAVLLQELLPTVQTIGELCCGDFSRQAEEYRQIGISHYVGLDISAKIVAANQARGLSCLQDIVFWPPLSVNCDGRG